MDPKRYRAARWNMDLSDACFQYRWTSHEDNVTRGKGAPLKVKRPFGKIHDGRGVCHRCHNRCIRCFRPVVGPPRRQRALHERRCRAGEMVLQSQTRTSRRVEQLPLNGAVQIAARHARTVGRVLINSDRSAIAGCRKRRMSIARMLWRFLALAVAQVRA